MVLFHHGPDEDRDLGRIPHVGAGTYSLALPLRESRYLNLVARLFADGRDAPIASSTIHYGIDDEARLVIDYPDPLAGRSEYERVTASLAPALHGRPLAALPAEERAALSRMSGVEESLIARLAAAQARADELWQLLTAPARDTAAPAAKGAAARMIEAAGAAAAWLVDAADLGRAAESAVGKLRVALERSGQVEERGSPSPASSSSSLVPPLYALLAASGEGALPALLLLSRAALQRGLAQAAANRIIPASRAETGGAIVEALIAGRDLLHFNLDDDGRHAPAKALAWAPITGDLRSRLLDALLDSSSLPAALDSAGLSAAQKGLLSEILTLFEALRRHAPMLAALAESKDGASIFKRGDSLDQDRLQLMSAGDWRALVDRAGFPAVHAGKTDPKADYAADIAASIAAVAPGRNLAARLAASTIRGSTALARTLSAYPQFDIRTQPVATYFAPEGGEAPALSQPQYGLLSAVQRVMRLAPGGDFAVAETMIANNYGSGYDLLLDGKAQVQQKLSPLLGPDVTDLIYRNAQQVFTDAYTVELIGQLNWLPGDLVSDESALPNLTTLFGNADFCTCAHCQSVYGPAAYLADLLHWMRADVALNGQSAYAELAARRPDIPNILLNCSNANTVMPYIDIGNEVLSYALLDPSLPRPALGDFQTHGESAERILEPEHRGKFAAVDAMLLKAAVQWALPYDPLYDEARACLEALGRDHAALVEALSARGWSARDPQERIAWACARFGLLPEEFAIVASSHAGAGIGFWKGYWGLQNSSGTSLAPGALVKPLLATGEFVDLAALETLLKTDFVRGDRPFPFDHVAFAPDAPCDVDQAFLAKADGTALVLDIPAADRLMRFERLRRRASLSVAELDHALTAFGAGGLDSGFICRLAAATAAAERLDLPLDLMCGWFTAKPLDWPADFAAALAIPPADLDAAGKLLATGNKPWHDPDQTLQFLFDVDQLRELPIAPSDMHAMLAGEGRWQLDAAGKAADRATAKAARTAWEALESALDPLPPADGAASAKAKSDRDNAIDLALASALGLPVGLVSQLTHIYVSAFSTMPSTTTAGQVPLTGLGWRAHFHPARETADPAGVKTVHRSWDGNGAVEGLFTEYYRFLWRHERIIATAGLEPIGAQVLALIAALKESPTWFLKADFPVLLDLIFNRFGAVAAKGGPLIWLHRAVGQAKALAVSQMAFLLRTSAVKQALAIQPFETWAAAEMDSGSVLAGLPTTEIKALADKARLFETGEDFGALVARMFDLAALREDIELVPSTATAHPLDELVSLVWSTLPGVNPRVENRFIQVQVAQLKAALKAAAGSAGDWARIYQPIANRLRRNLRDALVAYYVGQLRYRDASQIYARFLIDPEMEPCMKTSRIVQATNACQSLVQRGLLGLEPAVALDEVDKKEWVWRRNYRVWEANRKVFLYPENWIDPSLRLVKSPLFAAAQEQLLQEELNAPNVEKVFNTYLTGLEGISRLDIRGLYSDDAAGVLHVFARTWNPPYAYFYRRRESNFRWTSWEEIPIDIQGDHLIPVLFNRRLYLFWPTFTPKDHRTYRAWNDSEKGAPYVELRLCYSKLEFGKWSPKKQYDRAWICGTYSGASLFSDQDPIEEPLLRARLTMDALNQQTYAIQDASLEPKGFFFWAEPEGGDLVIHVRRHTDRKVDVYHLYTYEVDLVVSGCDERLAFRRPNQPDFGEDPKTFFLARPAWTVPDGMQLREGAVDRDPNSWPTVLTRLHDAYSTGSTGSSTILPTGHFPFTLTYAHQDRVAIPYHPFFLADRRHTHLIYSIFYFFLAELHEHPYCCDMLRALHREGIEGLLAPPGETNALRRQQLSNKTYFATEYQPVSGVAGASTLSFDFNYVGAYSGYNWEIFFHLPALIGHQLRLDGKHAEALRWLGFIFDPTNRDSIVGPSRYWMVRPFHEHVTEGSIAALMQLLQSNSPQDQAKRQAFAAQIAEWRKHPFEPHAVAEMRIQAYMRWTVMEYIETLIDWGDKLFRQFTTESVNEALQLYVLASEILGPEPRRVAGKPRPDQTFLSLLASLDAFSNGVAAIENNLTGVSTWQANGNPRVVSPAALYFCIPENPQLLAYWDRVADRLFKIRHCRDIDGNERELALFAPEIDPGMLVRAVASGLDLSEILDSLAAPNPRHRFSYLLQRANEFCNEVKGLGGQLLAALEKREAEDLSDLRQVHEINLLGAARGLKKLALEEAKQSLAAAEQSKKLAEIRFDHYSSRPFMIAEESSAKGLTETAHNIQKVEHGLMILSAALSLLDFQTGVCGPGPHVTMKLDLAKAPSAGAQAAGAMASSLLNRASQSLTAASYVQRQEDWRLQARLAQKEIQQADKQIASAEIRLAMAEKELDNHDLQVEQSKAVHDWMRSKFTNEQLYAWMSGKLKTLHRQAYNLAYDLARQAQKAFQIELGRTETYVEFGSWDSSRQGLLAGEMLSGQLRELEAAYLRFNTREFELTRSISLRLLNPAALVDLIRTGKASFEIPEWLLSTHFEDTMKLYAMRIRSVAVSVPCVTGPYTPTSVKLALTDSAIRWTPSDFTTVLPWLKPDMAREIVTSTAVNDPALFEANLRDERYLPFENAGAASKWDVSLPRTPEFDYQTISDLVLHMRFVAKGASYTAPSGPAPPPPPRPLLLMSWRHDLSDEWTLLQSQLGMAPSTGTQPKSFSIPVPTPAVVPYRLRKTASGAAPTFAPETVWILYRDSDGSRKLTAGKTTSATISVTIDAVTGALDDRVLTVVLQPTNVLQPFALTYEIPAGAKVVEDILVAFKS